MFWVTKLEKQSVFGNNGVTAKDSTPISVTILMIFSPAYLRSCFFGCWLVLAGPSRHSRAGIVGSSQHYLCILPSTGALFIYD